MPQIVKGRSFYDKPWYNSYRCMMSRCYREKTQVIKIMVGVESRYVTNGMI